MKLHELSPVAGSVKESKRKGRPQARDTRVRRLVPAAE